MLINQMIDTSGRARLAGSRRGPSGNRRDGIQSTKVVPFDRALHLVDLENLCGGQKIKCLEPVMECYLEAANFRVGDLVVCAASDHLLVKAGLLYPRFRLVRAFAGPEGADLALIAEGTRAVDEQWFSRIVIGSGDGAFSPLAHFARGRGRYVIIVCRDGTCSTRLKEHACEVRFIRGSRRAA